MENSPIPWSSFFQPSAVSFTAFDEILSCHPYWPTGCSENSKGRGEFSKLFYLQSALIFYFVFDFSVLLLRNSSSNTLDFGFELSALIPEAIERLLEEESRSFQAVNGRRDTRALEVTMC